MISFIILTGYPALKKDCLMAVTFSSQLRTICFARSGAPNIVLRFSHLLF